MARFQGHVSTFRATVPLGIFAGALATFFVSLSDGYEKARKI